MFARRLPIVLAALMLTAPLAGCDTKKEDPAEVEKAIASRLDAGDSEVTKGLYDDAIRDFNWVLEKEPENARALRGLGNVALEQGELDKAIEYFEKSTKAKADDPKAQEGLGDAYRKKGDHAKAAAAYAAGFAVDKENNATIGLKQGAALRESGDADGAEKVLLEVLDIDENVQFVYTELGDTYRAKKDYKEALKHYSLGQKKYASDKKAYAGTALVYEEQKQYTKAVDSWSMYIRMDCCSDYSNNTAKPKLKELQEKEQAALDEEPADDDAADGGDDAPADGE